MFFAVALFVVVLAVIASERVDRTKVALLGATLVVLTQTLDQERRSRRSTGTPSVC